MSEEEAKQPRKKTKGAKKAAPAEPSQKATEAPLAGEEAIIFQYMLEQNRPYSFQNILDNLRGQVKKTSGQRAADKLAADGKIQSKDFGKSRIYFMNQASLPIPDQSKLDQLDEEIKEKTVTLSELKTEVKALQQTLRDASAEMTDEELKTEVARLREEVATKRAQIEKIKAGEVPTVTEEERLQAEKLLQTRLAFESKRRRLAKDMLGALAESCDMKLSDLRTKIGLD